MNWLVAHLEVVFGGALALFTVLLLVQQRRSPQSTAAWLLFVFLLPYLALPMFLMFGIRKPHSTLKLTFTEDDAQGPRLSGVDATIRGHDLPSPREDNHLTLLPNGAEAFAALKATIEGARQKIDAEFYIVGNDPVGLAFVEALEARARDGLQVRLLIDGFGGLSRPRSALKRLEEAGGEVLISSPFLALRGRGRINLRNHRKTLIADDTVVFAGGMNVGIDYMSLGGGTEPARWIDLSFRLEGPAGQVYREILSADIAVARGRQSPSAPVQPQPPAPSGPAILQPVPSGPDIPGDPLHDALVCAIHRAERRIHLVTPYFLPTDQLGHALHIASCRGVDVRLLVPEKSNQTLANLARGSYLRNLRDSGGRIFLIRNRMIHAKAGIIDDIGWTGSANFDVRSMYLNFETALFIYDTETLTTLSDWMEAQFATGVEELPDAHLPRRVAEGAFRLIAPVL